MSPQKQLCYHVQKTITESISPFGDRIMIIILPNKIWIEILPYFTILNLMNILQNFTSRDGWLFESLY